MTTVVQVPAYREGQTNPGRFRAVLQAIASQAEPAQLECWVTPATGRTERIASDMGWEVYRAPSGKLATRNAAHDHALREGYDVLVSWDADTLPTSDHVLGALVRACETPGVVGANSRVQRPPTPTGLAITSLKRLAYSIAPIMHGQCHALTRSGWKRAGPFDTDLDQTNYGAVWTEEQYDFYRRLERAGDVVQTEASVEHDPRRFQCAVRRAFARVEGSDVGGWCGHRGANSFGPSRRTDGYEPAPQGAHSAPTGRRPGPGDDRTDRDDGRHR